MRIQIVINAGVAPVASSDIAGHGIPRFGLHDELVPLIEPN
jgi:hypothetical protein